MVNSRPPMGAAKAVATPTLQKGKAVTSPMSRGEKGRGGEGVRRGRGGRGGEGTGKVRERTWEGH